MCFSTCVLFRCLNVPVLWWRTWCLCWGKHGSLQGCSPTVLIPVWILFQIIFLNFWHKLNFSFSIFLHGPWPNNHWEVWLWDIAFLAQGVELVIMFPACSDFFMNLLCLWISNTFTLASIRPAWLSSNASTYKALHNSRGGKFQS